MKVQTLFAFTLLSTAALAEQCRDIPTFSALATNGKTFTSKSIANKTTVVVFLANSCPHNPHAVPDLNRLAKQFGKGVQLLGVVNADAATAKAYAQELKLSFPLIADGDRKIIKGFGAKHSLDLALICAKDKKIAEVTDGYSRATIQHVFDVLPAHGGPTLKPDLKAYPVKKMSGCGL